MKLSLYLHFQRGERKSCKKTQTLAPIKHCAGVSAYNTAISQNAEGLFLHNDNGHTDCTAEHSDNVPNDWTKKLMNNQQLLT